MRRRLILLLLVSVLNVVAVWYLGPYLFDTAEPGNVGTLIGLAISPFLLLGVVAWAARKQK
jgi:lipopolysaccharide export LptBFGC system permease protein LptF